MPQTTQKASEKDRDGRRFSGAGKGACREQRHSNKPEPAAGATHAPEEQWAKAHTYDGTGPALNHGRPRLPRPQPLVLQSAAGRTPPCDTETGDRKYSVGAETWSPHGRRGLTILFWARGPPTPRDRGTLARPLPRVVPGLRQVLTLQENQVPTRAAPAAGVSVAVFEDGAQHRC